MSRAHYNGTDSKGEGNYNMYRAWKLSGIKGRHYHMVYWNLHGTLQSRYMDTSDVGIDVGSIAATAESAGVASAVLVSGVLVAVAVAAVVACACKFVKVSIKGRAYVAAGVFIPFLRVTLSHHRRRR